RLRSKRSAAAPAQGASAKTPMNCAKLTTPTASVDRVRRNTRMAWAMFWNHVPQLESRFPVKYGQTLRSARTRPIDRGSVVSTGTAESLPELRPGPATSGLVPWPSVAGLDVDVVGLVDQAGAEVPVASDRAHQLEYGFAGG